MKHRKRILKALDYIFVLRPILFFPGITTLLAGYYLSDIPLDYTLINIILAFCLLMGSTFILNQLEDTDSDKNNSKLFLIEHGFISKKMAILESIILALVAFGIAFSTDQTIGFVFIGFFVITGIVYNLKPLQWKNYPWLGLLANLLMGVAAFTTGWLITAFFEFDFFIYLIPFIFFNTSIYLLTTLPDIDGDRIVGKETFAVKYGLKATLLSGIILMAFSNISGWIIHEKIIIIASSCSLPLFFFAVKTNKMTDTIRTIKFSLFGLSMIIAMIYPIYILFIIATYFLSRWYNENRFGFPYPTFSSNGKPKVRVLDKISVSVNEKSIIQTE